MICYDENIIQHERSERFENFQHCKDRGLLLCILLTLPMLTGCANELRDHAKEASIEERWDAVMQNKDEYVSKIVIVSSVFYPYWSSEVSILSDRSIENTEEVHQVIEMFRHQEVSFDKLPDEMDGIHAYLESKDSQKYMQILFLDKQENIILGVCIYEDNSAAIVEGTTLSDGRTYTYSANFSSLLFESIEAIYEGIE